MGHLWLLYLFPGLPFQGCHHQTCKTEQSGPVARRERRGVGTCVYLSAGSWERGVSECVLGVKDRVMCGDAHQLVGCWLSVWVMAWMGVLSRPFSNNS